MLYLIPLYIVVKHIVLETMFMGSKNNRKQVEYNLKVKDYLFRDLKSIAHICQTKLGNQIFYFQLKV